MMEYIIKVIFCSGLLLAAYHLLLERESFHHFKRMYLLVAVVGSFLVPLMPAIDFSDTIIQVPSADAYIDKLSSPIQNQPIHIIADAPQSLKPEQIFTELYILVAAILGIRFLHNIVRLGKQSRSGAQLTYANARLQLTAQHHSPFSFFKTIYVEQRSFELGSIPEPVLQHELAHVREWHSIDIVFMELVLVAAWINPFFYFYRKAIRLNHEFLADAYAVRISNNPIGYQQLLLQHAQPTLRNAFVSSFHFLTLKKRMLMLTKQTPWWMAALKQLAVIPVLLSALFLFANPLQAQDTTQTAPPQKQQPAPKSAVRANSLQKWSPGSTTEGVSSELLTEYQAIVDKYKKGNKDWWKSHNISTADRNRLEAIFLQMNPDQQMKQEVLFMKPIKPATSVMPTQKQLIAWQKTSLYGIWIDNKRVSNEVLKQYKPSDFGHYFFSRLYPNAANYGKHYYQVDLMTKEHYQEYYTRAMTNNRNQLMFKRSGLVN